MLLCNKIGGERMKYSSKWKMWKTIFDFKTCLTCPNNHGKIYGINEHVHPSPPVHPNCRCVIERLRSILAGTATNNEKYGADWYLKTYGRLPDYYITPEQAIKEGWKSQKRKFVFSLSRKNDLWGDISKQKWTSANCTK